MNGTRSAHGMTAITAAYTLERLQTVCCRWRIVWFGLSLQSFSDSNYSPRPQIGVDCECQPCETTSEWIEASARATHRSRKPDPSDRCDQHKKQPSDQSLKDGHFGFCELHDDKQNCSRYQQGHSNHALHRHLVWMDCHFISVQLKNNFRRFRRVFGLQARAEGQRSKITSVLCPASMFRATHSVD